MRPIEFSASYRFVMKDGDGEQPPSIALEPTGETLPGPTDDLYWLALKKGVTHEEASDLAALLNRTVRNVRLTRFQGE